MQKIKFNKGVTLIEVIISILLIFTITFSFTFIIPKLNGINKENQKLLEKNIFLQNSYQIFSSNPEQFKENLEEVYKVSWIGDTFYYDEFCFRYLDDKKIIEVIIYYNDEEKEIWKRNKVIQ